MALIQGGKLRQMTLSERKGIRRIVAFKRAAFQVKSQWQIEPNEGKGSYEKQRKQAVVLQRTSFNGRVNGTKH
jgi:hypothetical protein